MLIPQICVRLLWGGVFAAGSAICLAAGQVHLLGFVENLCPDEPFCFELRVESNYTGQTEQLINVRFEQVTTIFDPENYELTLEQSNIIPGSHLRLLLSPEVEGTDRDYRANYIWIGD